MTEEKKDKISSFIEDIFVEVLKKDALILEKDKEIARLRDDNKKLSARYLLELIKEVRAENKRLSTLLERRTGVLRWYADEENYKGSNRRVSEVGGEDRGGGYRLDAFWDGGNKASQALQDDGKGER